MQHLADLITAAVKKEGIDLIGFAGRDRFAGVDPQHNPFSIFPEGKTVIMLGKRVCRGTLRGVEEGTNFGDYRMFGCNWLEDEFLALACYNLTRVLEDEGWEACPLFPNDPANAPQGVPVADGRPAPNVYPDFDYAAVACGLGEIGFSGLFMSPQFGSRQRFHMVITDAELPATPLFEGHVCTGCGKCAAACPFGAIDPAYTKEIEICGKKMTVADVDFEACNSCKNGACPNRLSRAGKPDRMAALCNRTCVASLEEAGVLGNKFENAFRKREAWVIGPKKIGRR
ncbi:MAG: 4Fe-4S binding protein [Clostridia bacterium]|nr:4Fe-4S binding protein [Clostridia bacterium]MBQ8340200.1 4Fe-4S binding protein [Clostridia bacterium]